MSERESLFSAVREALQDGAGAGDARYIYPEAWEQLDRFEAALRMMKVGISSRPDDTLSPDEQLARFGQNTVIEIIEEALRGF